MTNRAFKIFTADQWTQFNRDGVFHGAPVDLADGYIHMSTADQVEETLAKHFAGQSGLVVASIDLTGFGDTLKWEISRGGALFPHLYAPLPLSTVVDHQAR
jgi:beta-hydroxylase